MCRCAWTTWSSPRPTAAPCGRRTRPPASTAACSTAQNGTCRLAIVNTGLFASGDERGQRKRWRGTAAGFANRIPQHAKDLQVAQALARETFVTHGAAATTVLATTGQGLALLPVSHPNDLFAGETASVVLRIDGMPAPGLAVEIVRGCGTRYRSAQDMLTRTTDAQGRCSVTWTDAGMHWLQSGSEDARTSLAQARQRRLSDVAMLEVLPQ